MWGTPGRWRKFGRGDVTMQMMEIFGILVLLVGILRVD